jgi:hypothetical protein
MGLGIRMKPSANITVEVYLNGHLVGIRPSKFTVQDGDAIQISYDVELPIIQKPGTEGEVLLVREVIRPRVEDER